MNSAVNIAVSEENTYGPELEVSSSSLFVLGYLLVDELLSQSGTDEQQTAVNYQRSAQVPESPIAPA
jgi:hypothetical protein